MGHTSGLTKRLPALRPMRPPRDEGISPAAQGPYGGLCGHENRNPDQNRNQTVRSGPFRSGKRVADKVPHETDEEPTILAEELHARGELTINRQKAAAGGGQRERLMTASERVRAAERARSRPTLARARGRWTSQRASATVSPNRGRCHAGAGSH